MQPAIQSARKSTGYLSAVRSRTWSDCKSGIRDWSRNSINGSLGVIATGLAAWKIAPGTLSEKFYVALLALPISLTLWAILHVLWSLIDAPRQVYYSQVGETEAAEAMCAGLRTDLENARALIAKANEPSTSLKIQFLSGNHIYRDQGGFIRMSVRVENTGNVPAIGLQLHITYVDPVDQINQDDALGAFTAQFNDKPLVIEDPQNAISMNPSGGASFLVAFIIPNEPERLYFKLTEGDRWMKRGRVRVYLNATAENAVADSKAYLIDTRANDLDISLSGAKPK